MMRGMSLRMPSSPMLAKPLLSSSKIRHIKAALHEPGDLRVIHGHLDLSIDGLLPDNARLITLLRDPVERAISHYHHFRRAESDPSHPLAMHSTLKEWVGTQGLVEMDNGQTRRLAGAMSLPFGQVTQQTLQRAKANLARFAVVGLTERFEESQILLRHEFNWPLYRYPEQNVGRTRRAETSEEEVRAIVARNVFDLELYRFAAALMQQATSKFDMEREVALLKAAPVHIAPDNSRPADNTSNRKRTIEGFASLIRKISLTRLAILAFCCGMVELLTDAVLLLAQL